MENRISKFVLPIFNKVADFFRRYKNIICTCVAIAVPAAVILTTLGIVLYYIFGPGEGYFHSDCTDTLYWAQASFDSGMIVSDNYNYAALLPFGGNLLMLIFMPIFGVTMTTHELGMALFAVLFILSVIYLARSLGYGWTLSSIMAFTVSFVMSSSDKLREIMWGHVIYYSLGVLFFCFGLGMAVRLLRDPPEKSPGTEGDTVDTNGIKIKKLLCSNTFKYWVLFAAFFIFTMLTATNGLQSVVLYVFPVGAAIFLVRITDTETKLASKRGFRYSLIFASIVFAGLLGLMILKLVSNGVTAGYANAYSTFSGMGAWRDNLFKIMDNWYTLLGVDVKGGEHFVSIESIINIFRIFGALLLFILPFVPFIFYAKLTSRPYKILLWSNLISTAFIVFACVFGSLGGVNWRLTPIVGTSTITVVATTAEFWKHREQFKISSRLAALFTAFICLQGTLSAAEIATTPADYGQNNNLHYLAEQLEDRGLTYGYADFWLAQAITVISDSEVKVRNMSVVYDGVDKRSEPIPYDYQSQFTWYDDQEGVDRYFLLVSSFEYHTLDSYISELGFVSAEELIYHDKEIDAYTTYYLIVFDKNPISK